MVRTPPFQGGNTGSTPVRAAEFYLGYWDWIIWNVLVKIIANIIRIKKITDTNIPNHRSPIKKDTNLTLLSLDLMFLE